MTKTLRWIGILFLGLGGVLWGKGVDQIRIVMIGDSTMATKEESKRPETGWGEALEKFFDESVEVENYAKNGRSSKSFIDEGLWDKAKARLRKGDVLIMQFGHNDEKSHDPSRYTVPMGSYAENLRSFAAAAESVGARVIIASSISRRKFDTDGRHQKTHGDYPVAAASVAEAVGAAYVDMDTLTHERLQAIGDEDSKRLFLRLEPGEHPNYPEGKKDDTHLSTEGARWHAALFLEALKEQRHPLVQRLARDD